MRLGVAATLVGLALCASACGSSKPETPLQVSSFDLQSKLLARPLSELLVTPKGGGKGRPLLVFLHGYGGTPSDTLGPAFVAALRRLGDRAPVVVLPQGEVGWWHDRAEGPGLVCAAGGDPGRAPAQRRRPPPRRDRRDLDGRLRRAQPR